MCLFVTIIYDWQSAAAAVFTSITQWQAAKVWEGQTAAAASENRKICACSCGWHLDPPSLLSCRCTTGRDSNAFTRLSLIWTASPGCEGLTLWLLAESWFTDWSFWNRTLFLFGLLLLTWSQTPTGNDKSSKLLVTSPENNTFKCFVIWHKNLIWIADCQLSVEYGGGGTPTLHNVFDLHTNAALNSASQCHPPSEPSGFPSACFVLLSGHE